MNDLDRRLRHAMRGQDKKIDLTNTDKASDKTKIYTAKTPEDLQNILEFFTGKTTRRIIYYDNNKTDEYYNNDKIDESKTYEVMKDKNGNEFILIYFIGQSRPVKCMKYKKGITGFAYDIKEDGTVYIGFYKNGDIQQIRFRKINIKEREKKKGKETYNKDPIETYDENPISYKESKKEDKDQEERYEDFD